MYIILNNIIFFKYAEVFSSLKSERVNIAPVAFNLMAYMEFYLLPVVRYQTSIIANGGV